jgi:hypothetical protein
VHDYNVDTLLAGKKLEDYLLLFHFIKCRQWITKPAIYFLLSLSPSKYFQNNIYQYATSAYHDFFNFDFTTTGTLAWQAITQAPQPVQAFKSIERLKWCPTERSNESHKSTL